MRTLLIASVLCAAIFYATCSPLLTKAKALENEESSSVALAVSTEAAAASSKATPASSEAPKLKETGRQSEDDDDDDDDDLDLGVDDDDDDDDEGGADDDDGDDDDYFESFFDDLLGEDDDDDDDDDDDASPPQQPVVAAAEPEIQEAAAAPAAAAAPQEEAQSASEEIAESGTDNPVDGSENETDSLIDKDPSELDAEASVQNSVQAPVEVQPVAADEAEEDEDEDDDDDEDDVGDLSDLVDDDDEQYEYVEDDEDDDDEEDLDGILESKRSRSLEPATSRMPSMYITKYNRFVDNIVSRINRILGKSYDPVRVRLHNNNSGNNNNKKNKNTTNKNKNTTKRRKTNSKRKQPTRTKATNKMAELTIPRMTESESREPAFVLISKNGGESKPKNASGVIQTRVSTSGSAGGTKKDKNKTSGGKTKANKKTSKPRATLFGLSSIKRDGDVMVNMMANHTTVKCNFIVGPLTLRVEKEFGSGARRELKSATATTAQMHGRITLRIVHGGVATLHSIKVLQPKQISIDSADNHDKTREYMWRRTARIASLVAQKLTSATRSMLKPPPRERHSH